MGEYIYNIKATKTIQVTGYDYGLKSIDRHGVVEQDFGTYIPNIHIHYSEFNRNMGWSSDGDQYAKAVAPNRRAWQKATSLNRPEVAGLDPRLDESEGTYYFVCAKNKTELLKTMTEWGQPLEDRGGDYYHSSKRVIDECTIDEMPWCCSRECYGFNGNCNTTPIIPVYAKHQGSAVSYCDSGIAGKVVGMLIQQGNGRLVFVKFNREYRDAKRQEFLARIEAHGKTWK